MQVFTRLTAAAAPIDLPNVDTDRVIPARFLRKPQGSAGYERFLFHDVREEPGFVLNRAPFDQARILVANANFGCGSSREGAAYAFHDAGFRSVIAPSFGVPVTRHDPSCSGSVAYLRLAREVAARG